MSTNIWKPRTTETGISGDLAEAKRALVQLRTEIGQIPHIAQVVAQTALVLADLQKTAAAAIAEWQRVSAYMTAETWQSVFATVAATGRCFVGPPKEGA